MKTLIERPVGGDGGKVGLYVEEGNLVQKASYPVDKLVQPLKVALEPLKAKLEALIPGDWENPLIDKAFDESFALFVKLLTE